MILFIFIHLYFLTSLIKVVNIKNINYQIVDKKITNSSKTFSLQVLYGSGVEKMNYLRCLYREGDTGNIRGTTTLSGGLGFTALNYSHSVALGKNRGQKRSHRQGLFL